ncbi:J domain-containing protein [Aquabacterium sp.]|uniref:J domain-containing protein n=1 Tax=Aquabacterium sp. TaxID=1872578 RepID=UPI003D6C791C
MNHYDCLKVTSDAPTEVIRAAYRALAGKSHPDRQGGTLGSDDQTHIQMVAINAAYEVLINPELRAEYDAMLAAKAKPRSPRPADNLAGAKTLENAVERENGFSETRVDIDWMTPKPIGVTPLWPLVGPRKYIAVAAASVLLLGIIWTTWQVVVRHQMDKALSEQYTAQPVESALDAEPVDTAQGLSAPKPTAPLEAAREVPQTPEEVLASEQVSSSASRPEVPPPSFERQPTVTELSKLSDEQLMAILPSLGELQPAKGSFSRQVASRHHPLDGKPLNLRTDRQLVDPLAPDAVKH